MNRPTKNQVHKEEDKIVLYSDKRGNVELRADIGKDTLWATQAQIARLFDVNPQAVIKHLKNIYRDQELTKRSTCSKMEQVQTEGGRAIKRMIDLYNLDAIIAVGYRVNSKKATQFRIWATKVLHNHLIKGYSPNGRALAISTDKFDDLEKAIEFMKSDQSDGRLKGRMSLRLSKDVIK